MKAIKIITLLLIILLAFLLRFYKITANPPHLYWDEASIAYNAYSVNMTGEDEWGDGNPFLFKSFGDYKLPLYIYVTAISQKLLGLTDLAVRAPSALAGLATVVVMFFFAKEQIYLIREKHKQFPFINNPTAIAATAALFLAISPWALQFSRGGFEANVALFCRTFGAFLFLVAMRKNNYWILFSSLLLFATAVYTYHSAVVTAPLILAILVFLFRQKLLVNWHKTLSAFLLMLLVIVPYAPSYLLSAQGRTQMTKEEFTRMPGNPVNNLVNNYVANFSLDYLFFHGDQNGRQSVKKLGELYLWQLPAILAGVYFLLRYRCKTTMVILSWILIESLPPALTVVSPHSLRGLLAVQSWQMLSATGFVYLLFKLKSYWRYFTIPIILFALLVYLKLYYFNYLVAYAADWQDGERQAVQYLRTIEKDYDKIYVYSNLDPIYIYLYWPVDPALLQANNHDLEKFTKFKRFSYTAWPTKTNPAQKFLVVAPAWMEEPAWQVLRQIKNKTGDAVYIIYGF